MLGWNEGMLLLFIQEIVTKQSAVTERDILSDGGKREVVTRDNQRRLKEISAQTEVNLAVTGIFMGYLLTVSDMAMRSHLYQRGPGQPEVGLEGPGPESKGFSRPRHITHSRAVVQLTVEEGTFRGDQCSTIHGRLGKEPESDSE